MKLDQKRITELEKKLEQAGLTVRYRSRGELRLQKCPKHRDKTPSLSINVFDNKFRCLSCDFRGSIGKLLAEYGINWGYSNYNVPTVDELEQMINDMDKDDNEKSDDIDQEPPYHADPGELKNYRYYHTYMESRGFNREFILANKIGFDPKELRATIPVIFDGIYYGCARRSVVSDTPKIKYNAGMPKEKLLYAPLTNTAKCENILIVEGPLDALKASLYGQDVYAILGCTVSETQMDLIYEQAAGRPVIWGLDYDKPGRNGIDRAISMGYDLSGFFVFNYDENWADSTGKCDIGMLTKEQFSWGMENAVSILEY